MRWISPAVVFGLLLPTAASGATELLLNGGAATSYPDANGIHTVPITLDNPDAFQVAGYSMNLTGFTPTALQLKMRKNDQPVVLPDPNTPPRIDFPDSDQWVNKDLGYSGDVDTQEVHTNPVALQTWQLKLQPGGQLSADDHAAGHGLQPQPRVPDFFGQPHAGSRAGQHDAARCWRGVVHPAPAECVMSMTVQTLTRRVRRGIARILRAEDRAVWSRALCPVGISSGSRIGGRVYQAYGLVVRLAVSAFLRGQDTARAQARGSLASIPGPL